MRCTWRGSRSLQIGSNYAAYRGGANTIFAIIISANTIRLRPLLFFSPINFWVLDCRNLRWANCAHLIGDDEQVERAAKAIE